ncbi:MAG: bacillithiol system redox-active protein YtxJ [Planctomycetota bacterium]
MKASRAVQVMTAAELEQLARHGTLLLFKHQRTCPISAAAFDQCRIFLAAHAEVRTAWLDVRASRDLAQQIARDHDVRHESPQALLLRDGKVVWHASHDAISAQSLARAVRDHAG